MPADNPGPDRLAALYTPRERLAFRPPDQILVSQWAERNRVLTRRQTSRPGPWRNANSPALVGLMDLCIRRTVREIWLMKAAQIGASEAVRNFIGYVAQIRGEPLLLVLPNEQAGRKIVRKRIIPLFEDTPCLAELATGVLRDKKLTSILLANGFQLELGWSGSPQALASDPFAVAIGDEVDKYEEFAGKEASAIDLIRARLRTYHDRSLALFLSTPTTRLGQIFQGYDACPIKLHFFAPCPHCKTPQRLVFGNLEWEKFKDLATDDARADRIRTRKAAWYNCDNQACRKRIEEHHRRAHLNAAFWATPDGSWRLYVDGRETGTFPEGTKVGLQIHALHDLSATYADIAAEIVAAGKDPAKIMHLRNSTQADVFEQQIVNTTPDLFSIKCTGNVETGFFPAPPKILPPWCARLVMTVDTQKDHFWFVIRAWGHGYRSQRIHHGRVTSFEALKDLFDRAYFPYEKNIFPPMRCHMMGIDSGGGKAGLDSSRTDQVYQFALTDPLRIKPLKGASKPNDQPIRLRKVLYRPINKSRSPYEVWLFLIDTGYFQDLLQSYITATIPIPDPQTGEVTDEEFWLLNSNNDPQYNQHLANMHKVRVGHKGLKEMWFPKNAGDHVDLRDDEVYQLMMAHGPALCGMLPTPQQMAAQLKAAAEASRRPPSSGTKTPDGREFLATRR